MSEEIKELNNKYLVLKWKDIKSALDAPNHKQIFNNLLEEIYEHRKLNNKPQNQYLVLNLDDEIDLLSFFRETEMRLNKTIYWWPQQKVKDIAVALVNAILKAKGD